MTWAQARHDDAACRPLMNEVERAPDELALGKVCLEQAEC